MVILNILIGGTILLTFFVVIGFDTIWSNLIKVIAYVLTLNKLLGFLLTLWILKGFIIDIWG